jgi:adenine-specific DNA-methyltransferase
MLLNKEVLTFLKSYSADPVKINRLIVSAFIKVNNIALKKNKALKELIIKEKDSDYGALMELINIQALIGFEQLIEAFEFVISPEDKVITGAVYTPQIIRDFIVDYSIPGDTNLETFTVCDPACGCAGFLYTAAKKIKVLTKSTYKEIFKNNIFGLDIQAYSVERSKLLLSLLALLENEDESEFEFNIYYGNALNFNWGSAISNFKGFSSIIGNPPYVSSRNIDEESKQYLSKWKVCSTGHPDLYIPFFEIGLTNLKNGGILGFITMNTFFKSVNGRALREYFQTDRVKLKIIDFGGHQIFQSKSTYTCICLLHNEISESVHYTKQDDIKGILKPGKIRFNTVPYDRLNALGGWNLQEIEIIGKIEGVGRPFGNRFRTRNGIATLKNDIYIFTPINEDEHYYFLQNEEEIFKIERGMCKDIINPNKLASLQSIDEIRKKIIFPYYYDGNVIKLIGEEIFAKDFPYAYKYLSQMAPKLAGRDKGNGKYEKWYAYGRNQSLEKFNHKLFFPHITPGIPSYILNAEPDLLFYNGLAIIGRDERELFFLKKLMSSRLFWFYIVNSSKPYGSGYYSLSRNYIKNFGVYDFSEDDIDNIIKEDDMAKVNSFLEKKYGIQLN